MKCCDFCVLHDRIPQVDIEENGICSVCNDHTKNKELNRVSAMYFKKKLKEELDSQKNKHQLYDAIVLFSGGKDSTYLLDMIKNDFNLRVLALSSINPLSSALALENMNTVLKNMNVDTMKLYVDERMYKKLIKYSLEEGYKIYPSEGLGCETCSFLFKNAALNIALKLDIPFIFDGSDMAQTGRPVYLDGKKMKENAANGIKPFGKLHDIFDSAFHDEHKGSIYDYQYEYYKTKEFPSYVSPFSFIDYDFRKNQNRLNELGMSEKQSKTILTNCDAIPFFSLFSVLRYDAPVYIRTYASEIRIGYPFMQQSLLSKTILARYSTISVV